MTLNFNFTITDMIQLYMKKSPHKKNLMVITTAVRHVIKLNI